MRYPLISVLITAYNRENYIAEAIKSVLASTITDFELIIVDDGSTDNTLAICRQFAQTDSRITVYVNENNLGDYPNRNRAASLARGKYLKYVDSDDIIYPYSLAIFTEFMESHSEVAIAISSRQVQMDTPFPIVLRPEESIRTHFFKTGYIDTGPIGVMIRAEIFHKLGGFANLRMVGDTEMWIRIAMKYPIAILQPGLVFWRVHDGQEFQFGMINDVYLELNYKLIQNMLRSGNDEILNEKERHEIQQRYDRSAVRSIVKKAIKNLKFGHYISLYKSLGLGLKELKYLIQ
jgi:glycosyltransferase involved in cell wall biosynthesis